MALGAQEPPPLDAFIVADDAARDRALALAFDLRRSGLAADLDLAERSAKGQMKQADRSGARYAVFLEGDGEPQLREMESGQQRRVAAAELAKEISP
jgi:histidyl-tRNA synthetase